MHVRAVASWSSMRYARLLMLHHLHLMYIVHVLRGRSLLLNSGPVALLWGLFCMADLRRGALEARVGEI